MAMWLKIRETKMNFLHQRMLRAKFDWIDNWDCVPKKNISDSDNLVLLHYLHLEKENCSLFSTLTQGWLCYIKLKLALLFLKRRFFYMSHMYKLLLRYFLPLTVNTWPFLKINLHSLHPKMLCVKFGWNCLDGSWEDKNVKTLHGRS